MGALSPTASLDPVTHPGFLEVGGCVVVIVVVLATLVELKLGKRTLESGEEM